MGTAGVARTADDASHKVWATSIPTNHTHSEGDEIFNPNTISGEPTSFICTVSGNPGTWEPKGVVYASATTTELEDISNSVNTAATKVEGYRVYNTSTNLHVIAAGAADADVWVYEGTGNTAHTPV